MIWTVTLTNEQLERIKSVSLARNATNRSASNPDGAIIDSLTADEIGAVGEEAVSTVMKLPWDGKHFSFEEWLEWRKSGSDVSGLEVKCTKHPKGRLWVREHEKVKLEAPYILVKADKLPEVTLAGWAYGKEIKQDMYWEEGLYGKPVYYIPNNKLHPMDDLLKLIGKKS
jgi:hypothetical protein